MCNIHTTQILLTYFLIYINKNVHRGKKVVAMLQFGFAKTVSQHFAKGSVLKLLAESADHRAVKTYWLTPSSSVRFNFNILFTSS